MTWDYLRTGQCYQYEKCFGKIIERRFFVVINGRYELRDNTEVGKPKRRFNTESILTKYKLIHVFRSDYESLGELFISKEMFRRNFPDIKRVGERMRKKLIKSLVAQGL